MSYYLQNKENVTDLKNNLLFCPICKLIPKIIINELTEEITYICSTRTKKTYSLNYYEINKIVSINILYLKHILQILN